MKPAMPPRAREGIRNLADLAPLAFPKAVTSPSLRQALRVATAEVHARLHLHAGLAAVAAERIDIASYRRLLLRLYGFYLPFEHAAGLEPLRSGWLASDLVAVAAPESSAVPICTDLPCLVSPPAVIGAMYVIEGSALGGRGLAQHLGCLLDEESLSGRRFFASDGADTTRGWRAYIHQLETVTRDQRPLVIDAAIATFGCFETWMDGWEAAYDA